MEYKIPEPDENPNSAIVLYYKVLKGNEYDDRSWDKIHFMRCSKSAKELLEVCGTFEISKRCLDELSKNFEEMGVNWTFETIIKHSHEWKNRRKPNDKQSRQRFFDALTKQRTEGKSPPKGETVTGGKILSALGNLEVFQDRDGNQDGRTNNDDGKPGKRMEPPSMEAKEA